MSRLANHRPPRGQQSRSQTRPQATHVVNAAGSKWLRKIAKRVTGLPSHRVSLEYAEKVCATDRRAPIFRSLRYPLGDRRNLVRA